MNIILYELKLKNFKGIRDLTIDFAQTTEVFGDNATGKTTMFDAFSWLLFDKDSNNKKDFDIKTLDADGKVLPGLDHEVEGALLIDTRKLTLRKVFSEKWTKKRGSATSEFTGHTTDYYIDGVPVKQKEYKDRIDELVDEGIFKLLTSPTYFNEQLSWQAQRNVLLEVCGNVSDKDVIASNETLGGLSEILNGRSIDDHRKIVAGRRSEINKELDKLPIRIDEAQRSKPDLDGLNESDLRRIAEQLRTRLSLKESEINRLQSGGEVAVQDKRLHELESELLEIKNRAQSGSIDAVAAQRAKAAEAKSKADELYFEINRIGKRRDANDQLIADKNADADRLRHEWVDTNSQELDPHIDANCPTCGQGLPAERVQAAHDKAIADFNRRKSESLERIAQRGTAAKAEAQKLEAENAELARQSAELNQRIAEATDLAAAEQRTLEELQSRVTDVTDTPEYVAKKNEIAQVKSKIVGLRQSVLDDVQRIRQECMDLRDELGRTESQLASFAQVQVLDARIEELKQQERDLSAEYERLEQELYLTEEFIRAKVNLLEERINSRFRYARFKLFEEQVNGALAETCETLYEGVPYGSGLNNAAKINVGLDIINTLSEHYGLTAPIFIDNRESVTRLIDVDSQVVSLIVSEADKKLRIQQSHNTPQREAV